uniref:GTPase domain-containing protein n=1 Tax=Brachyspira sp. TaxID=1977261 RepID=UPI003D7CDECD
MTEEQRKQCKEIIELRMSIIGIPAVAHIPIPIILFSNTLHYDKMAYDKETIDLIISLAKVFNKDITEEKAFYIAKEIVETNYNKVYPLGYSRIDFIKKIGWATADYFDNNKEKNNNENKINNVVENTAKEKIMSKEEQYKKCEEIINSYEEKYNKDLEEALYKIRNIPEIPEMPESEIKMVKNYISILLFSYDKSDSEWNIASPLHLEPIPQDKAKAKFHELLAEPKNKTVENIIDLTVSLSEVFGSGITKEEAEKLLFNKKSTEIDGTLSYLNIFTGATEKFIQIMQSHEKGYLEYENYEEEINSIKNIGGAIANYFDNEENKINKVVEDTAKEKIMSNNDDLILNLLILGQTGVGKSSLINALLGKEVAKAGAGKPITTHIKKYETELDGKKINLYDSMGFEVDNEKCITDINDALKERGIDKPIEKWFHSVTYCIQAGGLKIQDFDIKMIKQFTDKKYNVIIALTKAEQINEDKEKEFIEIIKKEIKKDTETDIMVIPISAKPEKLRGMTEEPKPFGLPEYKAAILVSWEKIFIDRIPLHIIEKLKENIKNAKYNAPNYKPKDDDDLKKLAKEIDEYFINIINKKLQIHIKESFEKYNKITENIITINTNID